jgi:hypothetical protein
MNVAFVDTSIVLNLLRVPGKAQSADECTAEHRRRKAAGEVFILPATAVIETGNHISQLNDGRARRECATKFETLLANVLQSRPPWTLHEAAWNAQFIEMLRSGAGTKQSLVELFTSQALGAGDLAILAEARQYASRVAHCKVTVWTLDRRLRGYSL